ncbi:Photosynthetic reaction center cytochrome C subunit [bacterium A37T11]|nr:Photosynthetic reaction center cytochrome C subunit [bacterium A37T11]
MPYKKITIFSALLGMVVMLSAFMTRQVMVQPHPEHKATNLKVLPKDISHDDLHKIMDDFKVALGVKCNFCHAPSKLDSTKLDFASDELHHKEIARDMMRMTAKINKKYFNHPDKNGSIKAISCVTCHNGEKHPKMI